MERKSARETTVDPSFWKAIIQADLSRVPTKARYPIQADVIRTMDDVECDDVEDDLDF